MVARAAGSVGDEARAWSAPPGAALRRRAARLELLRDADRAAAAAGNWPLELQARHAPAPSSSTSATWPRPAPPSTRRPTWPSAAAWPGAGTGSTAGCCAHRPLPAGSWDEAERVARTADERRPAVSAAALYVEVGRAGRRPPSGWPASPLPRRRPVRGLPGRRLRGRPGPLAGRPGAVQRAGPRHPLDPGGGRRPLGAERHLAGRPRPGRRGRPGRAGPAAGRPGRGQGAPGRRRGRAGTGQGGPAAGQGPGRQVGPEALAWLARAEAEWTRVEGRPTRAAGRPRPTPSATATCTRRPGAAGAWPRRCCWRPPRPGGRAGQGGPRDRRAAGAAPSWPSRGPRPAGPPDLGVQPAPAPDGPGLTPRAGGAARPPAAPTARSPRPCSSAARRPASTSPTSWPSWACTPGPRRRPRPTASVWTTPPARWP